MSQEDFVSFFLLTSTVTYPMHPITRQVQTTANTRQTFSWRRQMSGLHSFLSCWDWARSFQKMVFKGRMNLQLLQRAMPAITLPLLTLLTRLLTSVCICMYCLEVRTPRGSVVMSPRSLEDSSRRPGLDANNSTPQAPTRPGHFCPRIFCQTFKILINLHSDLPDPKEDGWGSRWPFTCSSICPATADPLKRQLGRNLLPEFWRLAHSPLYPFLSSLYALVFLVPLPNHFSFTQKKVLFPVGEGKKMTLSKYHFQMNVIPC